MPPSTAEQFLAVPELQKMLKISRASGYRLALSLVSSLLTNVVRVSRAALYHLVAYRFAMAEITANLANGDVSKAATWSVCLLKSKGRRRPKGRASRG